MGSHLRVLNKSYLMNTNMTGFRWFSKIFASLDESSLSIQRVKNNKSGLAVVLDMSVFVEAGQKVVLFLSCGRTGGGRSGGLCVVTGGGD